MLSVSQMERINVFRPKRKATGDTAKMGAKELSTVGKIHLTVFDPTGRRVVGFMVKKPDVASMIKVPDAFLALDSFVVCDLGLVATRGDDSFDDAARKRLGLDWERCIIWAGMDAKTTDGKVLGWVSDVSFSPKTGKAKTFYIGDGAVSSALVGNVEVPAEYLRGYRDGYLLLDPKAATLQLDGGAAAKAGTAYAKAKYEGGRAAKKAASSAGRAVQRGAFGLGKMIGDTKRAFDEASADTPRPAPQEVKSISEPLGEASPLPGEVGEPQEFVPVSVAEADSRPADGTPEDEAERDAPSDDANAPCEASDHDAPTGGPGEAAAHEGASAAKGAVPAGTAAPKKATGQKKPSSKPGKASSGKKAAKRKSDSQDAARAIGRQLGRTKGMFGAFVNEYKKASR